MTTQDPGPGHEPRPVAPLPPGYGRLHERSGSGQDPGAQGRWEEPDGYGDGDYGNDDDYRDDEFGERGYGQRGGDEPPDYTGRRSRQPRRRRAHPVLTVLAVIVVVIILAAGGFILWAQGQINPGGHHGPDVSVVIPAGSSTSKIADLLASHGVIHDSTLFALYVRLHGDGPLLPGSYQLPKNSSYQSTINALESGPKILTDNLVIPEGYTLAQIAAKVGALPGMGLSAQKFLADAESGTVRSAYEPSGVNNLEGLLFPATYQVRQGETEVDVLEDMIGAFDDRAEEIGLQAAAKSLGETPYQLVTVASIVEREAKLAQDRPLVASVIYNRLKAGMPLGADSTQTYYLRLSNPNLLPTAAQLDQPSPYNTRLNKGLPPTPIANPGLAALQAAASPTSTNYLYFVEIKSDGQLGYASTNSGFESLEAQCQAAKLC